MIEELKLAAKNLLEAKRKLELEKEAGNHKSIKAALEQWSKAQVRYNKALSDFELELFKEAENG